MKQHQDKKNTVTQNGTKMAQQQEQAIHLLAAGKTAQDVSRELGVSADVIDSWQQNATFEAALNKHHADTVAASARRLRYLLPTAIDTMESILTDAEAPAPARLSAATTVLKLADLGRRASAQPGPVTADEVESKRNFDEMFKVY